tara:strand:- start:188 stop:1003 length:816 start_codon:yes stop_codon:yes gene_type:complete
MSIIGRLKKIIIKIIYRLGLGPISFIGPYESWQKALDEVKGYQDKELQEYLYNQALKVREGKAVYERDGVLFDQIQRSWPLSLSIVMASRILHKDNINILDYGGSYGTTAKENEIIESALGIKLNWQIIENEYLVSQAKKSFTTDRIRFFYDLEEITKQSLITDIVLFGSCIQYIEHPYKLIDQINTNISPSFFLFDRTSFSDNGKENIYKQIVKIKYKASYPVHALCEGDFLQFFRDNKYNNIFSWDCDKIPESNQYFRGFFFKKDNIQA